MPATVGVSVGAWSRPPSAGEGLDASTARPCAVVLVLGDQLDMVRRVHDLLRGPGYHVRRADTCTAGIRRLADVQPDLIITSVALPDLRGAALCWHLRTCSQAAILVIAAEDEAHLCVEMLDAGADEFVVWPLRRNELLARVRALRRRVSGSHDDAIAVGEIQIDLQTRDVVVAQRRLRLRPKEFDLLLYLARHPRAVQTYRTLLAAVWGPSVQLRPHYVRMAVAHLRQRIEPNPERPSYLLTERSVGYRLDPSGGQAPTRLKYRRAL